MTNTYLRMGDWSNDGHGQTKVIQVCHNVAYDYFLIKAHEAGVKKLGVSMKGAADEYEDNSVPQDLVDALLGANLYTGKEGFEYIYLDEGNWYFEGVEGFARVWLEIAKYGNPLLEYEIVRFDPIEIGGYGLFG